MKIFHPGRFLGHSHFIQTLTFFGKLNRTETISPCATAKRTLKNHCDHTWYLWKKPCNERGNIEFWSPCRSHHTRGWPNEGDAQLLSGSKPRLACLIYKILPTCWASSLSFKASEAGSAGDCDGGGGVTLRRIASPAAGHRLVGQQHCPETLKTFDLATLQLPKRTMTASQGASLRTSRIGMQQHQVILQVWDLTMNIYKTVQHTSTLTYNTSGHRGRKMGGFFFKTTRLFMSKYAISNHLWLKIQGVQLAVHRIGSVM